MLNFGREFKINLYWHLFLVSASAVVFLWVIPLISWIVPIPVAVYFWFLYKKSGGGEGLGTTTKKQFSSTKRSKNYRSF